MNINNFGVCFFVVFKWACGSAPHRPIQIQIKQHSTVFGRKTVIWSVISNSSYCIFVIEFFIFSFRHVWCVFVGLFCVSSEEGAQKTLSILFHAVSSKYAADRRLCMCFTCFRHFIYIFILLIFLSYASRRFRLSTQQDGFFRHKVQNYIKQTDGKNM